MSMVSESLAAATQDAVDHAALAETIPLNVIDLSNPGLYQQYVWQPYFRRLRREAPVHYRKESPLGPSWSVTKHKDIIALEVNHKTLSISALGGITLSGRPELERPMFIAIDPPKHDVQRKVVRLIVSPENLTNFEGLTRARVRETLDRPAAPGNLQLGGQGLDRTHCQMLATLFDFRFEETHLNPTRPSKRGNSTARSNLETKK
jgi:cytochrome P450